jgi:hypothetical protein
MNGAKDLLKDVACVGVVLGDDDRGCRVRGWATCAAIASMADRALTPISERS